MRDAVRHVGVTVRKVLTSPYKRKLTLKEKRLCNIDVTIGKEKVLTSQYKNSFDVERKVLTSQTSRWRHSEKRKGLRGQQYRFNHGAVSFLVLRLSDFHSFMRSLSGQPPSRRRWACFATSASWSSPAANQLLPRVKRTDGGRLTSLLSR